MVINAMAPFILNSKLKPLMMRGREGWAPNTVGALAVVRLGGASGGAAGRTVTHEPSPPPSFTVVH